MTWALRRVSFCPIDAAMLPERIVSFFPENVNEIGLRMAVDSATEMLMFAAVNVAYGDPPGSKGTQTQCPGRSAFFIVFQPSRYSSRMMIICWIWVVPS